MLASIGGVVLTGPVRAQTDPVAEPAAPHYCEQHEGPVARVCRAGFDAVTWMLPLSALAASGGNPSLGTAGGSSGFGQVSITLRGSLARTVLPATAYDGATDTVAAVRRFPVALPRVDARFGIIAKVLPVGTVSADFLASVIPIPKNATEHVRFGPEVRSIGDLALGFGYGLRIAMQPNGSLPVASLNFGRTALPTFGYGDLSAGSTYAYTLSASAINARLLVGKRWGNFELTGGGGVDLLSGRYSLSYKDPVADSLMPRVDSTLSGMRIVTLTNLSLVLGPTRITFEGGFQIGKDEDLATIFQAHDTRAGTFFGGIGFGIKL